MSRKKRSVCVCKNDRPDSVRSVEPIQAGYFYLSKKFRFEASHQLLNHDGKCRNLHGHSWNGEIWIKGKMENKIGHKANMVVDYSVLGEEVKKIEERFDHKHLNDILPTIMPTSEYLCIVIAAMLFNLPKDIILHKVVIEETCTSRCEYVLG